MSECTAWVVYRRMGEMFENQQSVRDELEDAIHHPRALWFLGFKIGNEFCGHGTPFCVAKLCVAHPFSSAIPIFRYPQKFAVYATTLIFGFSCLLLAVITPLCRWTIFRQIANPMPEPL